VSQQGEWRRSGYWVQSPAALILHFATHSRLFLRRLPIALLERTEGNRGGHPAQDLRFSLNRGYKSLIQMGGEGEMKTILKWLVGLYVVLAIITLVANFYYRYPICSGFGGCSISYVKGAVWSAIWPVYWYIQRG
jgi:hypothetical protein